LPYITKKSILDSQKNQSITFST